MDSLPDDYFATSFQFTPHIYHDQYPAIDPTRPELSLARKVAIVTGASRGIGAKAFVPAFAKAGIRGLVLLATDEAKLNAVEADAKALSPDLQVLAVGVDITDKHSVEAAFDKIKAVFGHADILINNAGVNLEGEGNLVGDEDPDDWWRNFEVNTKGTFLVTRYFIRQLPSKETPATIINLVTLAAWKIFPHLSGYGISKAGALQLAEYIAAGYPNITNISVHPGLVDTDMLMDQFRRFTRQTPELIGGLAVWLSHPHARFLSGRTIGSHWSVEDLVARKEEIMSKSLLHSDLKGDFDGSRFQRPEEVH
ncbi:NAD(P)-binding protein [Thozetella sp. PMI_491]|nr:NAD(P)-binding protein [Thozetella sp. PMI_491]